MGMLPVKLCVTFEADAERPGLHSHAERGSDPRSRDACMDMSIPTGRNSLRQSYRLPCFCFAPATL
ncbi:hypothetical protein CUN61_03290 [Pseudomonas arsenicoxydans]|uniref:Uncharacterized protein n=1 Tax=Pseudomonas arsenicoxydans TaxID=702115 RepID=A0A4P6FWA7_9PSED|nr:hypothetical protein CUN61_03290 [Pseudomonas arsenicoxydans]